MSAVRFTSSEAWINSTKYLHKDGQLFKIRDTPRGKAGAPWSFHAWVGAPAGKTAQAVFERAWSAATPCSCCGMKCDSQDVCYRCFTAAKIRLARLSQTSQSPQTPQSPTPIFLPLLPPTPAPTHSTLDVNDDDIVQDSWKDPYGDGPLPENPWN